MSRLVSTASTGDQCHFSIANLIGEVRADDHTPVWQQPQSGRNGNKTLEELLEDGTWLINEFFHR
jgi:hypothetical protein